MAGPVPAASAAPSRASEVEDAVFETVREKRPAAAVSSGVVATPSGLAILGTVARDEAPARQPAASAGIGFWCVGAGLALAAFWFAGGHALATRWSDGDDASPVRLASLSSEVLHGGKYPLLMVDGSLQNASGAPAVLPPLTVNITDGDGRITRYRLGRIDGRIAAHGSWRFSSRLEAPRSGVSSVTVTVGRETSG